MIHWDKIVSEHGPLVWRTAYRLLGNEADAADCCQEALAAALEFSRREAVKNWPALLQRLVTTQALDRLRRRRVRLATDKGMEAVASSEPAPIERFNDNELMDRLRVALAELPEQQARAFWLICIEELTYQQAAEQLETETNHVGVLLHRARARLRELMANVIDDVR